MSVNGSYVSERSTLCGDDFRSAAMALESIGDVSGLVRTDGGLCILRYAGDVVPGAVAYEDVRDELRATYEEELRVSRYNATVIQWIEEANPRYHTEVF